METVAVLNQVERDADRHAMKTLLAFVFASSLLSAGQISVRVYDLSGIVPATLERAINEASRIFAQANVEARWKAGDPNAQEAHETDQSAPSAFRDRRVREYLVLRIGRGLAVKAPPTALGISYPHAQFGVSATVFEDRIEDLCTTPGVDFAVLLGYAIAHELGHVVLALDNHSSIGIMRARLAPTELPAARLRMLAFTPDQATRIKQFAVKQEQARNAGKLIASRARR
jgi:hypothetical protein